MNPDRIISFFCKFKNNILTLQGFHNYIIQILLEKEEDPTVTCKRKNCALQLLLKWNYILEDDISDYKRTLRLLIGKMQELHGDEIINKIFPNGDTCLHTAGKNQGSATRRATQPGNLKCNKTLFICYYETAYLTFLVKRAELTTVKILIEHGADIFQEWSKNLKIVFKNLIKALTG